MRDCLLDAARDNAPRIPRALHVTAEIVLYAVRKDSLHEGGLMAGDLGLPHTLLEFIRLCVPTFQAAEVLLFFASNPDRDFSVEEIVVCMRPAVITVPAVKEYTELFAAQRVVTANDGRFRYGPFSSELERAIGELSHAYNEKPVTLIRAIYHIADSKIQSFADSFKLRKD